MPSGTRKLGELECVNIIALLKDKIRAGHMHMRIVADIVTYLRSSGWEKDHALARAGNIVKRARLDVKYDHTIRLGYLTCSFLSGDEYLPLPAVLESRAWRIKNYYRWLEEQKNQQTPASVDPPTC